LADEVDVETTIVGLITAALYPSGILLPSVVIVGGVAVKVLVFRGWPTPQQQQAAIAGNFVNVSVASRNNVERNMSRYPIMAQTLTAAIHTLTATVGSGLQANQITIGGTVSLPQNVILLVGPFTQIGYGVQAGDTLSSIAAGLAANVNAVFPGMASAVGSVVSLNTGRFIIARVSGAGTTLTETKRQEKLFQIVTWAPPCNLASQDADAWRTGVVRVLDPMLSALIRIVLPDQSYAHIVYQSSWSLEAAQSEGLYRRDLFYNVEYPTTVPGVATEIGAVQSQITGVATLDGTVNTFPIIGPPAGPPTVNAES
jgi:hypothetical protein